MNDKPNEGFVRPPPNKTPKKMLRTESAPSIDEAVKKAEANMAEFVKSEPNWAEEDLDRLAEAFGNAQKDEENRKTHLDNVYAIAHDLKGMGGNFGYPIVTDITAMMCKYIETQSPPDIHIVSLYVSSLRVVFENQLAGDGGEEGRVLVDRLLKLSGKMAESSTDGV